MAKPRDYGIRQCKRAGCKMMYKAATGNQKYCDAHKQSDVQHPKTINEAQVLMQLAASDFVNDTQRRVLVLLVAKHYS